MTKIKLWNATDLANCAAGVLRPEQVRSMEIAALVDTGAVALILPADFVAALGLPEIQLRTVRLADGSLREIPKVGDIRIEILGRQMTCDALVMPAGTTPLVGQIQLEDMDLVVDARSRELTVNPAHPDAPIVDVLCVA